MSKDSPGGFLSKVVQLVRGPGGAWGDSGQTVGALTDKQALKAAIERKRRNDFVRKREFDMLRAIRKREQQNAQEPAPRPSFFQSSVPSEGDGREQTIKKIDAIEAQMATHWWQPGPGEEGPRASQRLQAPPSDLAPLAGAVHLQAHAFDKSGNTWPNTTDSGPPSDVLTQPAQEAQWPLPGQVREPDSLPVRFGDEPQGPGTSGPLPLGAAASDWVQVLDIAGVEEAAVRFANGDDAGAELHLRSALAAAPAPRAAEVQRLLLALFRATARRQTYEQQIREWAASSPAGGAPASPWPAWRPLGSPPEPGAAQQVSPVVWTCPAVLDVAAVSALAMAGSDGQRPLVVDWTALASADVSAAQHLLTVLEAWQHARMTLVWVGAANLRRALRASTPSGRRENHPVWWMLRLAVLQLAGRQDEFDLAALDYCVTYGETPPDWRAPSCDLRLADQVPAKLAVAAPPGDAGVPTAAAPAAPAASGRLQGALQGDVTRQLNAIAAAGAAGGPVEVDCGEVSRADFVASGALLQWALALKDSGRPVRLCGVHRLLAVFFHIVGIADVAEVQPAADL